MGARLRRGRRATRRRGVGRARGVPLARRAGGRQHRPLRLRLHGQRHAPTPPASPCPIAIEELFWGDAGIGLSIIGSGLAAAGISGNGTPEQVMEWVPQCYGTADDVKLGAFCVSEPDAGSDVSSLRTRAVYDEANDEWVLNGTKAWITNGGIADVHVVVAAVDPELKGRGQASFVVPPGTKGLSMGQKYKKHGIRASHTSEVVLDDVRVPGALPARRQGEARREAGPGPRGRPHAARQAAGHGHLRGHPPGRRRPGPRRRPRRLRVLARVRQGARGLRPADHHEPGHRLQAGRHEDGDRRRPPARAPGRVDGRHPQVRSWPARARCRS